MDRTLTLSTNVYPAAARLKEELAEKGLTAVGMSIEAVAAGAKLLNRPIRFKIMKVDEGDIVCRQPGKIEKKKRNSPGHREQKQHGQDDFLVVRSDQVGYCAAAWSIRRKKKYIFTG